MVCKFGVFCVWKVRVEDFFYRFFFCFLLDGRGIWVTFFRFKFLEVFFRVWSYFLECLFINIFMLLISLGGFFGVKEIFL